MKQIPEDAECVLCKNRGETIGKYGDSEIYICLDCYKGDKFRKWLDEKGIE